MIQTTEVSITYKGDGVQTSFPYPYPYRNSDDIVGYIINDVGYEKRITNNFKYDKVSNIYQYPLAGDPLAAPYSIKLIRETPQQQNADLPGKLPFSLIEKSLDWIIMILQEIGSRCNSLWHIRNDCKLSETNARNSASAAAESEENAANSEDMAKKWAMSPVSPDGVADTNSPTGYTQSAKIWAALSKEYAGLSKFKLPIGYYNSVDEMRASETAIVGRPCVTLGYYEPNDGGGGVYIIRSKKESDTDDGGSVIFLDNGNVSELIIDGAINVKQFGAKGDGVNDDITHFINAIDYVAKHKQNETLTSVTLSSYVMPIIIPTGIYNISQGLTLPAYICLKGQGDQASEIRAIAPMDAVIDIVGDDTINSRHTLKISGIRINCNNVALDGISNYASGVWLDGANFTNIYVYKALQYGIQIVATWCSNFDHITIDGASVGVAFHSSTKGNGFNNNKITNLNIHNCYLIGAFLEMQNSSITTLNIDRMGEYKYNDYNANLSTITVNNIVYDEPCAIYITGMTDTSSIDKIWFEWITKTTIPCILIKNIETYANKQFKAKTIEITDVHIGTACADIYHILSGNVIIDGLRYEKTITTAHIIDTTGASPNTSLFVKNISMYNIMNNIVNTLKYGAFTAQVVDSNGHISTFCPDYTNAFKYKNGVESFERYDDKTNTYVKYKGGDIVQRDVDNVTFLPQVAFNIKQTYTNSGVPDSWADLGIFPKVAGILPIVTPRSAESALVIQSGYYTQYQWVTGDNGKNHLQIRIIARASISISNASFGVAIYIENPTRIE